VLFGIFVVQAIGVALMPESSAMKSGALASLRPQVGVPTAARRPLLLAAPVVVAVWSLAGFYGSLGPSLVHIVAGSHSVVLGGAALFVLAGCAALTVFLGRGVQPRRVMLVGSAALVAGVGVTLIGTTQHSIGTFFIGTAIAGVGFGAGFQGALRTVLPLAESHERAAVLSTIYVLSYLALGLPAVAAGFLVVHGGVLSTAREYGLAVMVLALLALLGLVAQRPRADASRSATPGRALLCPAIAAEQVGPAIAAEQV
jgi:hypothetical protein